MNKNNLRGKIFGFGMTFLLLCGGVLFLASDANAQFRDNHQIWRDGRFGNRAELNRVARTRGYDDGLREGSKDARGRKRHNPYGKGGYKKATNGYNSRYGNKEAYRQIYRNAFLRGYDDAFYRNNRGIRINRRGW
ncbi:MAG TPA: hypothetical protein VF556_14315 [Pyrinomonadaceae bacterium]